MIKSLLLLSLFFSSLFLVFSEEFCVQKANFTSDHLKIIHFGKVESINNQQLYLAQNKSGVYLIGVASMDDMHILQKISDTIDVRCDYHSVRSNNYVLFYTCSQRTSFFGYRAWRTDGTTAGTQMVYEVDNSRTILNHTLNDLAVSFLEDAFFLFFRESIVKIKTDGSFEVIFNSSVECVKNVYQMGDYVYYTNMSGTETEIYAFDKTSFIPLGIKIGGSTNIATKVIYAEFLNKLYVLSKNFLPNIFYRIDGLNYEAMLYPNNTSIKHIQNITLNSPMLLIHTVKKEEENFTTQIYLLENDTTTDSLGKMIYSNQSYVQSKFLIFNEEIYFSNVVNQLIVVGYDGKPRILRNLSLTHDNYDDTFIIYNSTLFFAAYNESYGAELYKTDGTLEGTDIVGDIFHGSPSSHPSSLFIEGAQLYFTATDLVYGRQIYGLYQFNMCSQGAPVIYCQDINCPNLRISVNESLVITGYTFYTLNNLSLQNNSVVVEGVTELSGINFLKDSNIFFVGNLILENGSTIYYSNSNIKVRGCLQLKDNAKIVYNLSKVDFDNIPLDKKISIPLFESSCFELGKASISTSIEKDGCYSLKSEWLVEGNTLSIVMGKQYHCSQDNTVAIVLGVICGVIVLTILILLIYFFVFKKNQNSSESISMIKKTKSIQSD